MEEIFFIECGVRRRGKKCKCENCGKEFIGRINETNGIRKCCSRKCSHEIRMIRTEVECFNCGKKIIRQTSKLKLAKHGYYFCSRKCKEFSQSLEGNCSEIRPPHYKNGRYSYKNKMRQELKLGCIDCKEKRKYMLVVHHIDGDRENNVKKNLEVVCCNCHVKRHLKKTDGKFI